MVKNEDGEFELILGNRQLISVFLIVVILLGVFFSMGYIVGRNSAPVVAESARESKPGIVHAPASSDASTPELFKTSEPAQTAPEATTPSRADTGTHPAKDVAQSAPAPAPAPAPPQKAKSSPLPPAAAPTASVSADVAPGQYWQVVATARPDAEIITETLNKKGFHTVMSPAPKEGVFRVLVGPLKDASTQAQTRTSLEAAGFKNPLLRKY